MKFKNVKIQNLGNVENLAFDITRDIVVFPPREYRDILLGLSRAASNRLFYDILDREAIKEDTHVCGEFIFDGEQWRVESSYKYEYTEERRGKYVIRYGQKLEETYYRNGEETPLGRYYGAFHIPVDENARFWFCNGRTIDGEIADRSRIWTTDVDFNTYFSDYIESHVGKVFMREYVEEFCPRLIDVNKQLYLSFDENYRFITVKLEGGKQTIYKDLSESDRTIFNYFCFLEVNRFTFAYFDSCGFDYAKKPLFIFNFAEYLDESVDIVGLLKQAVDLGSQVFLFTGGHEIEGLKDKEGVQILEI